MQTTGIEMKKTFVKKIKLMLETQREEIIKRIKNASENNEIDQGGSEETDVIQAKILALAAKQTAEHDKTTILKIDSALNRIKNGNFGVCTSCDEDIDERRLVANPNSALCISCAEGFEIKKKRGI